MNGRRKIERMLRKSMLLVIHCDRAKKEKEKTLNENEWKMTAK